MLNRLYSSSTIAVLKDYKWMRMCLTGAQTFSTCGKRKYFAIVLDEQGRVLSTGYNGGPTGMKHCEDGECPRLAENSPSGSSYDNCIAIHAEANALLFSDYSARRDGAVLYVNGPPCFSCAKLIANSGIRRVVYIPSDEYSDWPRIEDFLRKNHVTTVSLDEDWV